MAGTWSESTPVDGYAGGNYTGVRRLEAEFTDDATAGAATVPVLTVGSSDSGGFLQRFSVKFDATTPPSGASFTVVITDANGIAIGNPDGTALTESSNITVNAYFVGPLYINVTDNETNSAKAVVSLYVR